MLHLNGQLTTSHSGPLDAIDGIFGTADEGYAFKAFRLAGPAAEGSKRDRSVFNQFGKKRKASTQDGEESAVDQFRTKLRKCGSSA